MKEVFSTQIIYYVTLDTPGAQRRRKKKFLTIFCQKGAKTHVDGKWSGISKTLKPLCARPCGKIQEMATNP